MSAYGRGHWLASELKRQNIPVTVIDLSSRLGVWPPEDLEGPFGYFKADTGTSITSELAPFVGTAAEGLSVLQAERVIHGDNYEIVPQGFTIWLQEGPLELKSPLTNYRLKKLEQSHELQEILQSTPPSAKPGKNLYALQKWSAEHFSKSWILGLAHQLAATTYHPNARASLYGKPLKLMDPFYIRKATRAGQDENVNWLKSKNVEVLEKTEILDLSFKNKNTISGVELQGERSGVMHIQQMVWMLNSEESYFVYPKIAAHLFPEGELEPEWCWVRYRLHMSACQERDVLPAHVLITQQVAAPWTHQNLLILQRTAAEDTFDAWQRIPNVQRFNKEYLRIRGEKVLDILRLRLPLALPEIQSFPQEFYYTHSQIGPSPFPVYGRGLDARRTKKLFSNLLLDGSEIWRNFSWDEMFEHQSTLRNSLVKWWKLLQQRKEKERRD